MSLARRSIENLRRQDWTAVAIELVVVVLGVFLGVQASNWNAEREKSEKAAVFTERLKSDLREEAWGYELQVSYYGEVLANAMRAADALTSKVPLSDEALLIAAYRATQYNGNIRRRATYDELTSTGEIGLIRDDALRELAMRTYTSSMFDDIVREGQSSRYRNLFRMAIPHDVQHALAVTCGDHIVPVNNYAAIEHSLDYPCATGLSTETLSRSAAVLRGDSDILAALRLRIADIETDMFNLTIYYKDDIRDRLKGLAKEGR